MGGLAVKFTTLVFIFKSTCAVVVQTNNFNFILLDCWKICNFFFCFFRFEGYDDQDFKIFVMSCNHDIVS